MAKNDAKDKVEHLRALLDKANRAYYVDASPIMPDVEYDRLMKDLQAQATPSWPPDSSPSVRVGGEAIDGFETRKHAAPMLSIDNTYNRWRCGSGTSGC